MPAALHALGKHRCVKRHMTYSNAGIILDRIKKVTQHVLPNRFHGQGAVSTYFSYYDCCHSLLFLLYGLVVPAFPATGAAETGMPPLG